MGPPSTEAICALAVAICGAILHGRQVSGWVLLNLLHHYAPEVVIITPLVLEGCMQKWSRPCDGHPST